MYSPDLHSTSLASNDVASFVKCMICYKDFNSAKANRPDYEIAKRIFDNYSRLLKVQLILPMQWNFRHESLPFCVSCTSTVTKLLELNEKLHIIQNEIRVTLRNTKIEILKTQDANFKRMVEPLGRRRGTRGSASHLEKVDYFRSFAVKDMDPDVRLNVNNVLLKPMAQGQQTTKVGLTLPLLKHKHDALFDVAAVAVKVTPFSLETVDQDEYPDYDPAPSPDDMEDDNSDGATNSEVNSESYVAEGLIKLPQNAPLRKPKEYVTEFFTQINTHTYQCKLCERTMTYNTIKSIGNLKRHVVTVHENAHGYQCKFCLKTFSSSPEGLAHIRSEHSKLPAAADQIAKNKSRTSKSIPSQNTNANAAIPMEEILKRVIDLESGDKRPPKEIYKRHYKKVGDTYVCKICTRQMKSIKEIVRHVHASHKGKPNFQCSYCNKKFMERYMCVKHLKIAHDKIMQEEYQVLIVNENEEPSEENDEEPSLSTSSPTDGKKNFIKVGNIYKCKKCTFTTTHRTSIARHIPRWHNSNVTRPGLVKFSFAKKSPKPVTVSSTLSSQPIIKLANLATIKPSTSNSEVEKNEEMLPSDGQDGVLYVVPSDLEALVKSHIVEGKSKSKKRYQCNSCSYGSMLFANVRRHIRDIHLKILPYVCSFCKKGFFTRQKCRLHIILTHPEESVPNLTKIDSKPAAQGSSVLLGPPKLLPEVEGYENPDLESENNDSRLRRRKSEVSYVQDAIDIDNEIDRLCIALPKSNKLPFSPELLSKYVSESDSTFCLVCEKQFSQLSHHIANVHEEVRHFQCFLCNSTFYYRGKCIKHLKEKCLKENPKIQGDIYTNEKDVSSSASSSQSTIKLASVTKIKKPSISKLPKPKSTPKKVKAVSKSPSQPLQSGVYQDYYERLGKRFKCKICNKRILDSRRIGSHFVGSHKDICPFECGHCDEKFYSKRLRTKHWYSNHPSVAAELDKEYEKTLISKQNGPQQPEPMDTSEANIDVGETTIKSESTWVEFSQPVEEHRDQFLESNNESDTVTSTAINSGVREMARSVPKTPVTSSENVEAYNTEKSIENDAPIVEYGCVVIHQQSNLNCDPFIDKDSANKCKVCNKSFKLRKLVTDHIKNVHLGVRRYQCEFCAKKYYHLAACKTHVEDNHPQGSTERISEDGIADTGMGEQPIPTSSFGSSDLQISNVRSQASMDRNPLVSSEEITMDAGMMAVEEPMSFEPWRELPSSQDKNIEPFFAVQSDSEEEDEEEPQFVVQEQNGMGFSTDYEMTGTGVITDEVSIYDIVGTENIIDLPVNTVQSDTVEFSETGSGFSCNICKKEFASRKSMINHVNVKHKQVARFGCKLCEKKYYHKYHVAQHIASIHMRKDIFKCRVCEKSYGHASGLKKHYAAAHGSVNFQSREQWCAICKLPFQSPQDLISHMSRIHPV